MGGATSASLVTKFVLGNFEMETPTREASAIFGRIGPVAHMNEIITDEYAYIHRVGQSYGCCGPTITSIKVSRDGAGPTGWYDRVTVWSGDDMLFEAPLFMLDHVEYPHDKNANPEPEMVF